MLLYDFLHHNLMDYSVVWRMILRNFLYTFETNYESELSWFVAMFVLHLSDKENIFFKILIFFWWREKSVTKSKVSII